MKTKSTKPIEVSGQKDGCGKKLEKNITRNKFNVKIESVRGRERERETKKAGLFAVKQFCLPSGSRQVEGRSGREAS